MAVATSQLENVLLENLKESMIILRYTKFTERFQPMDDLACKWLQHNFKGVNAIIKRNDKRYDAPIEKAKAGDILLELHSFPESLKKLTHVSPGLVQELKKRGFLAFTVKEIKKQKSEKEIKREASVQESAKFIDQVKENVKVHDGATVAVEDLLDHTRDGDTDLTEIKGFVEGIVNESSTEAIGIITSLKQSDQTYAHCIEVGSIFQSVYVQLQQKKGIEVTAKDKQEILMGAFMHDIGKAKVPKDVLDSTERFERDSREMKLMQSHPTFGAEILTDMGSSDMIINMAHYHHVKLDTSMKSSYPLDVNYDDVIYETRLIAIVDVYQALVGRRSYKKSWAPPAAMKFIEQLSGIEFDLDTWDDFYSILGQYPVGSLVELNDGSYAFVTGAASEDMSKPKVAVIRNAQGEDVKNNTLIDLQLEQDIVIAKELDSFDVLGDKSLEIFTNLNII